MSRQPRTLLARTPTTPDDVAVRSGAASWTFAEFEHRIRQVANGLRSEGLGVGDRWAVLARNRIEWPELAYGNGRAGCRQVPLNWHLTAPEITELLVDADARVLVVDAESEAVGREAAVAAGVERIITLGPDYEAWLAAQSDDPGPDGPIGAPMQYTGGTTGRSKGVLRSDQGGLVSELAHRWSRWGELTGMPTAGRALVCTPAYHAIGGAMVRVALARGHTLELTDRWDPEAMLALVADRAITTTVMVPTQFVRLLKLDPEVRSRHDVSSLEWVLHTAAPCPVWAKRAMIEWWGPVIVELYGSSEGTGPVVATSEEWLERPGTVGRASAALELSILDEDGNELPPGEIGTVWVKRFDGAPTYHGDPAKTAAMQRPDGRFTVGDVGHLDADGYLFLADRRVDLVIRGGTNIYPAEIEGVLSQHPEVADVAVFGVPDPEFGQSVLAVVEPLAGATPTEDSLRSFCAERLARFKVPSRFEVADSLPREASGKLKKRLLREPYWDGDGSAP